MGIDAGVVAVAVLLGWALDMKGGVVLVAAPRYEAVTEGNGGGVRRARRSRD
ncbi:hypothetical protein [Streptomyces sp. NBC_01353]|uniref:hypothetical protein n=1 Tax=Streptomyces sp. NBC_01353 TaxID=2903835 RepID=UPI002E36023B|nr:hypothetical protein [Streptomyces sp. NBC_01353]